MLCPADVSFPIGLVEFARVVTMEVAQRETIVFMTSVDFSALAVSKHMVRRVGVFDQGLWPAGVEDCDLMLRVRLEAGGGMDIVANVTGGHMNYDKYPVEHAGPSCMLLLHCGCIPTFTLCLCFSTGSKGSTTLSRSSKFGFHGKMMAAHNNNMKYYGEKWGGRHGPRWCGEIQVGNYHRAYDGKYTGECMVALSKQARRKNERIFSTTTDRIMADLKDHVMGPTDISKLNIR